MTITDEIRHKAWDAFTNCKQEFISDRLEAVLEAVAPMLIAAYLRKAATEMGGDIWLEKLFRERAQELDPQ